MRWIIFALSLGTFIMSTIHSVFMLFGFLPVSGGALPSWLVGVLTLLSAVLALVGGLVAFNRNRMGSVFLMLAALLCIIAPSEFWIYGSLYLIATVFCFFLPRYPDFDFMDDEDYEDDEEDEDEEEPEVLADRQPLASRALLRRREQASRVVPGTERSAAFPPPLEDPLKVRKRTLKTCPTCGANVAIDHRYCPTCGSSLHIPAEAEKEGTLGLGSTVREDLVSAEELPASPVSEPAATPEPSGERPVVSEPFVHEKSEKPADPVFPFPEEEIQVSVPHKVLVKPLRENAPIPKRPLNIDPDAAYQEFSQYARRKKRRTRSFGRRVFGVFLLLALVGGTTWFLLGLRKLPENELPVRPVEEPVKRPSVPVSSGEPVAQPQPVATPVGGLPSLTLRDRPERGRVTGSNVNLREDHSTASKSLARLQTNTNGEVLDTWEGTSGSLSGPWYRIRTGDGKEGWIYGQYFLPQGAALPKGYTDALLRSFGAGRAEVVAGLGQPAQSKGSSLTWQGLTVTLSGEAVARLQLTASGRELKNGVKVGMTQKELVSIMGYPSQGVPGQWRYVESDGRGVGVQLNKDGSVKSVTVGKLVARAPGRTDVHGV